MKLPLPAGDFRAYLFDCDGTIVDSMPLHYLAWSSTLAEWNCPFPEELFYEWGGKPIDEIISTLNQMHGLHIPVQEAGKVKESRYFELLPQLKAIPEVVEHIEEQYGRIPFAVVSGGRRTSVTRSLTAVGLIDKFPVIVGAGDYKNSKPAADPFLVAAERLGVAPEHCLVFEDTDLGIQAATAAGMDSVLVPSVQERRAAAQSKN
jgi:HAD superfamily hydrolase (TIGR01509 family)